MPLLLYIYVEIHVIKTFVSSLSEYGKLFLSIFYFSIGFEPLGDEGAEYLASALKENKTLEALRYDCVNC